MSDYIEALNKKLVAAQKRVRLGNEFKQLKANAPSLFEIIETEIDIAFVKLTQDKPLPHDEYLSLQGQVVGMRKIMNLIASAEAEMPSAAQEAVAIEEQLKQFKDDKKSA